MSDKNITWDDIPSLEIDDGNMMSGGSDKRRHIRLSLNAMRKILPNSHIIAVRLFSPKAGLGLVDGWLSDLSRSGAKITIEKSIPKNEIIDVLILLPDRKIKCKGMIKWVKQEINLYNIGVEFIDMSAEDSSYIAHMISTYNWTYWYKNY